MLELAALFSSGAALVISGYALYLASLKPPALDVDVLESSLRWRAMSSGLPTDSILEVSILVANTGARGTVLQHLAAEARPPSDARIWREAGMAVGLYGPPITQGGNTFSVPAAFEVGDLVPLSVRMHLKAEPGITSEEFARRLPLNLSTDSDRSVGLPAHRLPPGL